MEKNMEESKITQSMDGEQNEEVLYTRKKQEEMLETGVQRESVTFPNGEITMAGDLYLPRDFDESKQYAAIICVHTGTGVKEQVSGDYAAMLAGEG